MQTEEPVVRAQRQITSHLHMHMYICIEDVCHTCSSLELASAGKYQATAGVESVCVECVCVCATTKIMHRILRCGTKHNI